MSTNANLVSAKIARNDEYFTRYDDVVAELSHYPGAFYNKKVFLPCDSPAASSFWRYFEYNFDELGLASLTATSQSESGRGSISSIFRDPDGYKIRSDFDLEGDGDMFSEEVASLMRNSDIVVTNLPFSRFRDCIRFMMDAGLDFIVIGGKNGGKYQDTVQYVIDGQMRLGANESHGSMVFDSEDGPVTVGSYWYTTLVPDVPPRGLVLDKSYAGHEPDYPRYANYDAIEVGRVSDIPADYDGAMGVPVTFLEYYDPDTWELLGTNATVLADAPQDPHIKARSHLYRRHNLYLERPDGTYKRCYDRLIVRRR